MLEIGEFPHHDAHHYENDERQATLTFFLLTAFVVSVCAMVLIFARAL